MAEIEMIVDRIYVSKMNYQRVVNLKEKASVNHYLPIWVGPLEADAIAIKLQSTSVSRPLAHDFICSIIKALDATLISIVINELRMDVFYAKTRLKYNGKIIEIDCRVGDAIAIAIRGNAPIFVEEEILKVAGQTW